MKYIFTAILLWLSSYQFVAAATFSAFATFDSSNVDLISEDQWDRILGEVDFGQTFETINSITINVTFINDLLDPNESGLIVDDTRALNFSHFEQRSKYHPTSDPSDSFNMATIFTTGPWFQPDLLNGWTDFYIFTAGSSSFPQSFEIESILFTVVANEAGNIALPLPASLPLFATSLLILVGARRLRE